MAEFSRKVDYLLQNGVLPNAAELFVEEIERALNEIRIRPGKSTMPGARKYFRLGPTKRFSYSLIYRITNEAIEVLAIAAPQRRFGYWKNRKF